MNRRYKINNNFIFQKIKNSFLIFFPDESALYTLNDTATYIVECIQKGLSYEEIIPTYKKYYNIPSEEAKQDIRTIYDYLKKEQIIVPY